MSTEAGEVQFKLPLRVLVEAADPDIADTLTFQDASDAECVRKESTGFGGVRH